MQASDLNRYDLGYLFYPARRESEPGHARLDFRLAEQPSGRHFDPEGVDVVCYTEIHGVAVMRLEHPWHGEKQMQVLAGALDLEDRRGKTVEVFSFGGQLQVEGAEAQTLCVFTSPAPILNLHNPEAGAYLLAEEVEILLAERRGHWGYTPGELDRRLQAAKPLELYLACLKAILNKYRHLPYSEDPTVEQLLYILRDDLAHFKAAGQDIREIDDIV